MSTNSVTYGICASYFDGSVNVSIFYLIKTCIINCCIFFNFMKLKALYLTGHSNCIVEVIFPIHFTEIL